MLQPGNRRVSDAGKNVGKPRLRIDVVELEASERSIVPDIGPDAARIGLPLAKIGTVVSSPCRRSAAVNGFQCRGACSDLIGQRRQAEVDAFAGIAFALTVERLVLGELLKQDHRQQVRSCKTAGRYVEWCRRLRDLLALAAGKLLPHRLDDRNRCSDPTLSSPS